MRRTLAAVLALLASCGNGDDAERTPADADPGEPGLADRRHVRIEISADRRFSAVVENDDPEFPYLLNKRPTHGLTLDQLGTNLAICERRHRMEHRHKDSVDSAGLPVVIACDPELPWLYVEWMLAICYEQRLRHTYLALAPGRVASVPGVHLDFEMVDRVEDPVVVRTRFRDGVVETALGADGEFRPDLEPADVRAYAADRSADVTEVRASSRTPARAVLELWAALRPTYVEHIHLHGNRIPKKAIRDLITLPRPTDDGPPRLMSGSGGFGQ